MDDRRERNVKGEIVVKGPNRVEWNLPDLLSHPEESPYYFESPYFRYRGGTWCFQSSNNPRIGSMQLFLKRVHFPSKVSLDYEMGVHIYGETEIVSQHSKTFFESDGQTGEIALLVHRGPFFITTSKALRFFCIFNTATEDTSSQAGGAGEYTEENAVNLIKRNGEGIKLDFTFKAGVYNLLQNFKDLLLKEEQSDILVKVKDKEFKAHKAILGGRSNVFSAMFAHDTLEKKTNIVEITDCEPNAFEQFLMYLYTGQVESVPGDQVTDLYIIADKYNVEDLKKECMNFMKYNMTVETFCDVMSLALTHNEIALIENATKYFAENVMKIIVTAKWITFAKENPVESKEIHTKALKHGNKN